MEKKMEEEGPIAFLCAKAKEEGISNPEVSYKREYLSIREGGDNLEGRVVFFGLHATQKIYTFLPMNETILRATEHVYVDRNAGSVEEPPVRSVIKDLRIKYSFNFGKPEFGNAHIEVMDGKIISEYHSSIFTGQLFEKGKDCEGAIMEMLGAYKKGRNVSVDTSLRAEKPEK